MMDVLMCRLGLKLVVNIVQLCFLLITLLNFAHALPK